MITYTEEASTKVYSGRPRYFSDREMQFAILFVLVLVVVLVLECGIWGGVENADGYSGFMVPKGLNDSSDATELAEVLAVYCQEMPETPNRPDRERYDWVGGTFSDLEC